MSVGDLHLVASLLALLGLGIYSILAYDALLELEYREHPYDWWSDGQPIGGSWKPPSFGSWVSNEVTRGRLVASRLVWRWMFATPAWARSNPRAESLLRRVRVATLAWLVGAPAMFLWTALRTP